MKGEILDKYIIGSDHDGLKLEFPLLVFGEIRALVATLLTLAAVPSSLVVVALPYAAWVESRGWWLVNEAILTQRWLVLGSALAAFSWLLWPRFLSKEKWARLKIERWRILLRDPGGERVVHTRDLARVWVTTRSLRLERRDGTDTLLDLPAKDPDLLFELAELIVSHAEQDGSEESIPESLRLLRDRPTPRRVTEGS